MAETPPTEPFRISLGWTLILVTVLSAILGLWKFNKPTTEPPLVKPKGWDDSRIIQSQQALDILSSPDRVVAYHLNPPRAFGDDPINVSESSYQPLELDDRTAKRISTCLTTLGNLKMSSRYLVSQSPQYSLKIVFSKDGKSVNVYFEIDGNLPGANFEYEQESVGFFYKEYPVFHKVDSIEIELEVLFGLANKIRLQVTDDNKTKDVITE